MTYYDKSNKTTDAALEAIFQLTTRFEPNPLTTVHVNCYEELDGGYVFAFRIPQDYYAVGCGMVMHGPISRVRRVTLNDVETDDFKFEDERLEIPPVPGHWKAYVEFKTVKN